MYVLESLEKASSYSTAFTNDLDCIFSAMFIIRLVDF
jgi:hypothetical protein